MNNITYLHISNKNLYNIPTKKYRKKLKICTVKRAKLYQKPIIKVNVCTYLQVWIQET